MMATMTALVALLDRHDSAGAALPSARRWACSGANDSQLIVSLLFLGFGVGQFFYGPVSEKRRAEAGGVYRPGAVFGRLPARAGRQKLSPDARTRVSGPSALAVPRAMTIALVRDKFEGRAMARVMSLVMAVFILVPVIAPSIGPGRPWIRRLADDLRR